MRSRGSVLITVTWVLSILAIFTLVITRRATQELFMGQWMRDRVIGRAVAKAGVERALYEIQKDEFITYDTLNESWASNETAFKDVPMGDGTLFVSCYDFDQESSASDGQTVLFGACDEASKVDMNTADATVIIRLLLLTVEDIEDNEATKIAESILDWRDSDDATRPSGAEANFYKAFPYKSLPRDGPFETLDELRMVRGVTPEVYAAIEPHVTVYSNGTLNFNTISPIVMQAYGIGPELAQRIVLFRSGEDEEVGTEDDQFFQIAEGITPALSAAGSFSPEDFAQISNLIADGVIGVGSDAFRIRSIGRFIRNDRAFDYVVQCVVTREGNILYWRETTV